MQSEDGDIPQNKTPEIKVKRQKRFFQDNLGPTHIDNKKESIKISQNPLSNKQELKMEKKNTQNNLHKTIEILDFASDAINGLVTVKDYRKNKTIMAHMKNGQIHGKVTQLMSDGSYSRFTYVNGVKEGPMKIFQNNKNKNLIKGHFKNGQLHKKVTFKNANTWQTFKVNQDGKVQKPLIQTLKIPFLILQTIFNLIKRLFVYIISMLFKMLKSPYNFLQWTYNNIKQLTHFMVINFRKKSKKKS